MLPKAELEKALYFGKICYQGSIFSGRNIMRLTSLEEYRLF